MSSFATHRTPTTTAEISESPVVAFLRKPKSYPDRPSAVELIETHISWVFLTDRFVYKLKKPVRFEFLDFSHCERRRAACLNELKLNRRLAPDVYLDVVPITVDSRGRMQMGGAGRVMDWVVKMSRLPAGSSLDRLVRDEQLKDHDVDALAGCLARFYSQLPPRMLNAEEYLHGIERHVRGNLVELAKPEYQFDSWLLQRLHGAQRRFFAVSRGMLTQRVGDGRIVDGHGDLRPDHIYLTTAPTVIDCIEFSDELRTIDVVDELAFLAMECDRLGVEWIGQRILSIYSATTGDRASPELIEFFKCYRACVRAKVHALRSRQVSESNALQHRDAAIDYLWLADQSASRLGPPLLMVVRGCSGAGKSTVALSLSDSLGCNWFQTDDLRRQLFPNQTAVAGYNVGRYTTENRRLVYDAMFRFAEGQLMHGLSVVLDGTFLTRESCRRAIQLAHAYQAAPLLITCVCPVDLAIERIQDRGKSASEASPEFVERQLAEQEELEPGWPKCTVNTSEGLTSVRQKVFDCVRSVILARCANPHSFNAGVDSPDTVVARAAMAS